MDDNGKGKFPKFLSWLELFSSIVNNLLSIITNKKSLVRAFVTASVWGAGIFGIYKTVNVREKVLIALLIAAITAAIAGWSLYLRQRKKQKEPEPEGRAAVLSQREIELRGKNAELLEKATVLEKAFRSEIPPQVGFYVTNKSKYDDFKTDLHLLECTLEVRLPKSETSPGGRNMHFRWILTVQNDCPEPAKIVHFIFSGEKGLHPNVTVIQGTTVTHVPASLKQKDSTGDDCFIGIKLPTPIKCGHTAQIIVDYTSATYQFRKAYDTIWIAPDALGFTAVSEFRICVFHDREIIVPKKTECILRTYQSSGEYSVEDDQLIRPSKKGDDTVFQCGVKDEGDGSLHKYVYLLVLINEWDQRPLYLQDIQPPPDNA